MSKKYCLFVHNQSYLLETPEVFVGINREGTLSIDGIITKYIRLKKIKEEYYLYPLVPDLQINYKKMDTEKSHLLHDDDVIKIKEFTMRFKELSSQKIDSAAILGYLISALETKYSMHYIAEEGEHLNTIFAINKSSKQHVMVKAIDPRTDDVIVTNEFRRECRLVKKMMLLQHDNLAKVIEVEQSMFPRYYITEYVQAKSIKSFIDSCGKLGMLDALKIIEQIASVLMYLHDNLEILHRNISPESISLTYSGEVKINNLGALKSNQLISLTCRGDVKGSLLFTDPNVYSDNSDYSIQSDMYSLGLLFIYMLTGNKPLQDVDEAANFDITSVNMKNQKFKSFLTKLLHKEATERFEDYTELIAEIKKFYPSPTENTIQNSTKKSEVINEMDSKKKNYNMSKTQRVRDTSRMKLDEEQTAIINNETEEDITEEHSSPNQLSKDNLGTNNLGVTSLNENKYSAETKVGKTKENDNDMKELFLLYNEIKKNQETMLVILNKLLHKNH